MTTKRLLPSVLALMGACILSVAATGADTPKPADAKVTPDVSAGERPFIVHNPDGTFTVRKEPAPGKADEAGQKGLVIPPQVVVPIVRLPEKDPPNPAH